jgi:hypothetical protein
MTNPQRAYRKLFFPTGNFTIHANCKCGNSSLNGWWQSATKEDSSKSTRKISNETKTIVVVRNPYDRLVSLWNHRFVRNDNWRSDIGRVAKCICKTHCIEVKDITFELFIKHLHAHPHHLRETHFWRQFEHLPNRYTHLCRTETLSDDLKRVLDDVLKDNPAELSRLWNIWQKQNRIWKMVYSNNSTSSAHELTIEQMRDRGASPKPKDFWTSELREMAFQLYKSDFDNYGYSK